MGASNITYQGLESGTCYRPAVASGQAATDVFGKTACAAAQARDTMTRNEQSFCDRRNTSQNWSLHPKRGSL